MELEIAFKDSLEYRMYRITKGILDDLRALIVTEEGQREFREWQKKRHAESSRKER